MSIDTTLPERRRGKEIETIVKAIRDALETATMHHVSRDGKIQIAALVLHDELIALANCRDGRLDTMLLLKLAREVGELALEVGEKCGGPK